MNATLVSSIMISFVLTPAAFSQQADPTQTPPKIARPAPKLNFSERMKQYLIRVGGTVDESKSTADMIVSNSANLKGGKVTIVIVNDHRRNLVGFYVYNFGSLKNATNKQEVYKYLLEANDSITIGSFFVDSDEDIGYKYLVSGGQTMSQPAFETAYITMAAVARERKPEIKKLIGGSGEKEEKPPDAKKAATEKPEPDFTSNASSPQRLEGSRDGTEQKDPGVDIAVVTTAMANLRNEPGESSDVVLRVQKGSLLVLIDRTPIGPWYNVIDVASSSEGWVHASVIRISYTKAPKAAPVFEARRTGTSEIPTVEISNDSYKDLNLRIGTKLYTIPSNSKKTIRVTAGTYKYYASAPGVIPSFGNQSFENGYEYTWRFWIETVIR